MAHRRRDPWLIRVWNKLELYSAIAFIVFGLIYGIVKAVNPGLAELMMAPIDWVFFELKLLLVG